MQMHAESIRNQPVIIKSENLWSSKRSMAANFPTRIKKKSRNCNHSVVDLVSDSGIGSVYDTSIESIARSSQSIIDGSCISLQGLY